MTSDLDTAVEMINKYEEDLAIREGTSEIALVLLGRIFEEQDLDELEGVVAGCLYAACRENGGPVTIQDISNVTNIDRYEIVRRYRMITYELNVDIDPFDTRHLITRYCSYLNYDEEVVNESLRMLDVLAEKGFIAGKGRHEIAAGIIYYNKKSDISRISEVSNTSEDKIERLNEIIEHDMDDI